MSYNILGINISHNGSICVLSDGKIDFFIEEERISRKKYDNIPLDSLKLILEKYTINEIAVAGLSHHFSSQKHLKAFLELLKIYFPKIPRLSFLHTHHLTHAASSFYNSGFKKCLNIVIDGNGSILNFESNNDILGEGSETESVYISKYPSSINNIYKSIITDSKSFKNNNIIFSPDCTITKAYRAVTEYLGFHEFEAGKTMGLSSYGKNNPSIPNFFIKDRVDPKLIPVKDFCGNLNIPPKSTNWHNNPEKITNFEKDLSWKIQNETQEVVGNLIESSIKETNLKNICCSGGYFLNCVNNYYLKKRFPNIKFYFEPISSDAGTSIGAAKLAWYKKSKDKTVSPQKTLYYGPKYSKKEILKKIDKYLA